MIIMSTYYTIYIHFNDSREVKQMVKVYYDLTTGSSYLLCYCQFLVQL